MDLKKISHRVAAIDVPDPYGFVELGESAGLALAEGGSMDDVAQRVKDALFDIYYSDDADDDEDEAEIASEKLFDDGYWQGRWSPYEKDEADKDWANQKIAEWKKDLQLLKQKLSELGISFAS